MPYKKNYRRRYRRRPYTRMQRTQQLVNGKATKNWYQMSYNTIKRAVAGLVHQTNIEKKESLQSFNSTIPTVGGGLMSQCHLTATGQGTGYSNRIGNSQKDKDMYYQFNVKRNALSSSTDVQIVRVIIFLDKQNYTQNIPSLSDILQTSTNIMSHKYVSNTDRFVFLYDKMFVLTHDKPSIGPIRKYRKLDIHTKYEQGTSNVEENSIHLICFTDEPTNLPTINFQSKVSFYDN